MVVLQEQKNCNRFLYGRDLSIFLKYDVIFAYIIFSSIAKNRQIQDVQKHKAICNNHREILRAVDIKFIKKFMKYVNMICIFFWEFLFFFRYKTMIRLESFPFVEKDYFLLLYRIVFIVLYTIKKRRNVQREKCSKFKFSCVTRYINTLKLSWLEKFEIKAAI